MQMLDAGGMEVLTDTVRPPDQWNPRGYYEYEPVKSLERDGHWISSVKGKAVKVVSPLLPYLPESVSCRVIFVLRSLPELIASQYRMLASLRKDHLPTTQLAVCDLAHHIIEIRDWLLKDDRFTVLWLCHRALLVNPSGQARLIAAFLGEELDLGPMALAVHPELVHYSMD
jgi:hypothetical protein